MVKQEKKSRITTKLFAGFELTPEIKIKLSTSKEWQQASVTRTLSHNGLVECPFHDKIYLGRYLEGKMITLSQLKQSSQSISDTLEGYCPDLDIDRISVHFFPIVLVS